MRESMTHPWQVFDMLEGYFWDETSGTPQTFTVVHRTKCFVSVLHTKTGVLHRKKVNMSSDDPFFWLGGLVVRRPKPVVNRVLSAVAPSSGDAVPASDSPCPAAQLTAAEPPST